MKWLFLLLLMANVAVFGYFWFVHGDSPPPPHPPRPAGGDLILLAEHDEREQQQGDGQP